MLPKSFQTISVRLGLNEDKFAFSAVFEMNENAEVVKEWFGRTVIHSDRRFAYEEAQTRLETGKGDYAEELQILSSSLKTPSNRFKNGGIDFNTEEVRFELDEDGKPLRVKIKRMKEANKLIEDFMLLANVRVARFLQKSTPTKTFLLAQASIEYTTHQIQKNSHLRVFVSRLGYEMAKPNKDNSESLIRDALKLHQGHPN